MQTIRITTKTHMKKSTDKKTISNDFYELKSAAKQFGVTPGMILIAKEQTKSTSRKKIQEWIEGHNILTVKKS